MAAAWTEFEGSAAYRIATHGRRVTNVLMVTSTVRVLDGVHRHTTDRGPAVPLHAVLVEGTASLQQRFVNAATAGDDANRTARERAHQLLLPRGQTEAGLARVLNVANDLSEAARGPGVLGAVASGLLHLVNHRTGRHRLERQNVARDQLGCDQKKAAKSEQAGEGVRRGGATAAVERSARTQYS